MGIEYNNLSSEDNKMANNKSLDKIEISNLKDIDCNLRTEDSVTNTLTIDVIIPVYKPEKSFKQLIERLLKQSISPQRIILLHTLEESADCIQTKTHELLNHAKTLSNDVCKIDIYDIEKNDFDHGGTRNYGASLSQADVILFMTQDAIPADKDMIKHIIKPFSNEEIASAYGRQLAYPHAGIIENYTRLFNYPDYSFLKSEKDIAELGIKAYFCSNVCAAYRRTIYEKLGGFVTKTIFNEDMIMAATVIKNGYTIAYAAEAMIYHSHDYTYVQQFKRNFDLAVSQQQYKHIFSEVKSENEGIKLIKQTLKYLQKNKRYDLIPDFIFQSGFKYMGYLAGKRYETMPKWLIMKLSMNPTYWKQ
jgi:rhamnosyltransferase